MFRAAAFLLLAASPVRAQTAAQQPVSSDPLAPLDFLVGTWTAKTTGGSAGAQSTGSYTFARDLNGHELVRTTSADTCKGPARFDCQHHDQLYAFADPNGRAVHGSSLFAFYADSEGHIIYYSIATPDPNTAVFDSQNAPSAPKFRLTYHRDGNTMTGKFEIAAPGSSDFHPYLQWTGAKQ